MELVKVLRKTNNDLPVKSTPMSAARDIRAEVNLCDPERLFDVAIVYVTEDTELGFANSENYRTKEDDIFHKPALPEHFPSVYHSFLRQYGCR